MKKQTQKKTDSTSQKIEVAVVRIRGSIKVNKKIKDTMDMLHLKKINNCVILKNTPSNYGMVKKAKDYVTWGEINAETKKILVKRKSKKENLFPLSPPKGGFERKGTKKPFNVGGALGYRGDKINALIKKMI